MAQGEEGLNRVASPNRSAAEPARTAGGNLPGCELRLLHGFCREYSYGLVQIKLEKLLKGALFCSELRGLELQLRFLTRKMQSYRETRVLPLGRLFSTRHKFY